MNAEQYVIDMHAHFFPALSQKEAAEYDAGHTPWLRINEDGKKGMILIGNKEFRPVYNALWDCDRFFVDSAVFDPKVLRFLAGIVGVERIMLGSDYPFSMGERKVGSLIKGSDFTDGEKAAMLAHNAKKFFITK